jgi:hypothetical protein
MILFRLRPVIASELKYNDYLRFILQGDANIYINLQELRRSQMSMFKYCPLCGAELIGIYEWWVYQTCYSVSSSW